MFLITSVTINKLVDTKAPKDTYQFTQRGIIKGFHSLLGTTRRI